MRQVILLTDGDTNRQYHDHDALIAQFPRKTTSRFRRSGSAPNSRSAVLQDFAQATGGVFYRVQDIEKLPLLLVGLTRQAMNRRAQGRTSVEAGASSAILTGIAAKDIPPIDYYASTNPRTARIVTLRVSAEAASPTPRAAVRGRARDAERNDRAVLGLGRGVEIDRGTVRRRSR